MTNATIPWLDDKAPKLIDAVRFCRVCHKKLSRYNRGKVCYGCATPATPQDLISMHDKAAVENLEKKLQAEFRQGKSRRVGAQYPLQPTTNLCRPMSRIQIDGLKFMAESGERMSAKALARGAGQEVARRGTEMLRGYLARGFVEKFEGTPALWKITVAGRKWLSEFYKMSGEGSE